MLNLSFKKVTENGPGDELAMLCGHILLDLYHKTSKC